MIQFTDDIFRRGQFLKLGFARNGWNSKKDVCGKIMDSRRANSQRRVVPAMGMVTANKQTLREERMGGASVLITKGTQWSAQPFRPPCGDPDAHPAHHVGTMMPTLPTTWGP